MTALAKLRADHPKRIELFGEREAMYRADGGCWRRLNSVWTFEDADGQAVCRIADDPSLVMHRAEAEARARVEAEK